VLYDHPHGYNDYHHATITGITTLINGAGEVTGVNLDLETRMVGEGSSGPRKDSLCW